MFRIAICDDEETSLQLNKALTDKIMQEEGLSYEITTFQNMRDMISTMVELKANLSYDVLLCDVLTTDMTGIEAAEKLRELGENLDIIFISTSAEYAIDGYRVQALRYIKKPVDVEQLREALSISYRRHSNKEGLTINSDGKTVTIDYKDIIYIESCGRNIDVHVGDKIYTTHIKISDMEKLLPEKNFFRCHRSYIVNFKFADNLERYEMALKNGQILPVSQQLYSETKRRFQKR